MELVSWTKNSECHRLLNRISTTKMLDMS